MSVLTATGDNSAPNMLAPLPIAIQAADGAQLAGIYYPCLNPSSAVLICSGIGLNQKVYADFARWLNKEGFVVLTFDYRGIGESLFGMPVRKSLAKQHEWGQSDMTAALAHLHSRHPDIPLQMIAHNVAAALMGLMNNHSLLSGVVSIGDSALYVPQVAGINRISANLFFRYYVSLCTSWLGYVPLK